MWGVSWCIDVIVGDVVSGAGVVCICQCQSWGSSRLACAPFPWRVVCGDVIVMLWNFLFCGELALVALFN